MLVPGTQMHFVTFGFVCIELVILFYLVIHRLARPDYKTSFLNIILIVLLIIYNVTGGLLPDPNLPGSFFTQTSIAYATGFITPCYFPYYVYKAFGLEKMRFHAYKGVYLFLMLPYLVFVIVFAASGKLDTAKNLLVLPVSYALWVVYSLAKAIQFKYRNNFTSLESKEEIAVLVFSITPWVTLPVIDFFNAGQVLEASITNIGFLLLLGLHLKRTVQQIKEDHKKLVDSELRLLTWNERLQQEVEKRTKELEKISEQKTYTLVNLAHETKTPLTLITNYLEEYIQKKGSSEEIVIIKRSIDKLTTDILNLFDLERYNKGSAVYNHDQISNISEVVRDTLVLFQQYANKRNIKINAEIEINLFIEADPVAVNRIVNNLLENAIKFSYDDSEIEILLFSLDSEIHFSVCDYGIGIPPAMQKKIFEPYYQIANRKTNVQGLGLGLPIVKKVIEDLQGEIRVESYPGKRKGAKITVQFNQHKLKENAVVSVSRSPLPVVVETEDIKMREIVHDETKQTILIVEDNISMINYLLYKLGENHNAYAALNGNEALEKLKSLNTLPDLIISDVMMDKVDGFTFAGIISQNPQYNHIPFIFLTAKSSSTDRLLGLKLGAIDFIQKPFSIQELLQKVDSILIQSGKQQKALVQKALGALSKQGQIQQASNPNSFEQNCELYHLTNREKEIANLVCKGKTHKTIAETLFIAERTVAKHAQNIFEKTRVGNRMELCKKLTF